MGMTTYSFDQIAFARTGKHDPVEVAARLGYGAKGLVYATVGILAMLAAFGFASGKLTGTTGALAVLDNYSWGTVVLALTVVGLLGFTLWRFFQAVRDTENKGDDAGGLVQRAGLFISGLIYGWLAYSATRMLLDAPNVGSSAQERAATVMAHDGGTVAVGVVGLVFLGVALYQFYRAATQRFKRNWKTEKMSAKEEKIATTISAFGISARAVAFLLVGLFLAYAALTAEPSQARGLEGALSEIGQQTSGQWLVALTGLGLFSYGLYCWVNAFFRQITD